MIGLYKRSNKEYHLNYGHEQGNSNRKHHNDNNFQIRIMGNNNNYNPSRPINKPHLKPRPAYDQCYNYYRYYGTTSILFLDKLCINASYEDIVLCTFIVLLNISCMKPNIQMFKCSLNFIFVV